MFFNSYLNQPSPKAEKKNAQTPVNIGTNTNTQMQTQIYRMYNEREKSFSLIIQSNFKM